MSQNNDNSTLFKNKYRIDSARLKNWDYSNEGAYFITICTHDRECFFGEIKNNKMILSEMGEIIKKEWEKTAKLRTHISLGKWIIMPNHIHGILIIDNNRRDVLPKRLSSKHLPLPKRLSSKPLLTKRLPPIPSKEYNGNHPQMSKISPKSKSISTAIRFFKRQTTIELRKINPLFSWQPRFHDHIIRNEKSFKIISEYIEHNPQKWIEDKFCNI